MIYKNMLPDTLSVKMELLLVMGEQRNIVGVLFKSTGCCSLIELDEVFDRKSIKRDGAVRQLQSAEGSRMGAFYITVQTQYGK